MRKLIAKFADQHPHEFYALTLLATALPVLAVALVLWFGFVVALVKLAQWMGLL